jgi:trehalose/maltose transport system permease protein
MILVLAMVAGWPLLRTIYFSFTDANLASIEDHKLVGLANFLSLTEDANWWQAVGNTVRFAVISVTLETVLGLIIALTLNAKLPGRGLLRASVLIPWAIPTVVSAQMWNWMYNDLYGVLNHVFMALKLIHSPLAWTANPSLSLLAVIILAALQLIPGEIYEATRIDGVAPLKVFLRVTLPLIRPSLMVAIIFRTLDALRIFDLPYVLTGNSRDTASMAVFARQQLIDFQDVGYGSAASTFLFMVIAIITVIYITAGRVRFDAPER